MGEALAALKAPGVFALNWNIYGVDIDPRAVEICSVSLMIQVIDELVLHQTGEVVRFPSIMGENIKQGNSALCDLPAEGWQELFAGKEKDITELVALRNRVKETPEDKTRVDLRKQIDEKTAALAAVVPAVIDRKYHPFNWPLEFPEIFFGPQSGFAVVIGNPPYTDIATQFPPELARHRYETTNSGDLYTLMVENILHLTSPAKGHGGMIVPLSLTFSRYMRTLRQEISSSGREWRISSYDRIPDAIFGHNVRTRNSIAIMTPSANGEAKVMASPMMRWFRTEREHLFESLHFHDCTSLLLPLGMPRLGSDLQAQGLDNLFQHGHNMNEVITGGGNWQGGSLALNFSRTAYNWLAFSTTIPPITDERGKPTKSDSLVYLRFTNQNARWASLTILNGLLMYWFWLLYDDGFHVSKEGIKTFPVSPLMFTKKVQKHLVEMGHEIQSEMAKHLTYKWNAGKRIGNYNMRHSPHRQGG